MQDHQLILSWSPYCQSYMAKYHFLATYAISPKYYVIFLYQQNIMSSFLLPTISNILLLLSPILGPLLYHQNQCPFHQKWCGQMTIKSPI